MCGIAGSTASQRGVLETMRRRLAHRGPDDDGLWQEEEGKIGFAHTRLAVIDLSTAAAQPMVSDCGRYVLVYNGEIYNYRELRAELEAEGESFRSQSDTEVLLRLLRRDGADAVGRLVGMFAFALWDREGRCLWLCRDRLGIKPLYYGEADGIFLFGSELKALRAKQGWQPRIDRDALAAFTKFNYVPTPYSIYAGIRKLEPATLLCYTPGDTPKLSRYWDMAGVAAQPRRDITDEEAVREAERLLTDAVSRRMVSDVPLGALLSGGIDSATVVALMQRSSDRPVRTFTIGFKEGGFDEAAHARAVAEHLGTEHTEVAMSPEHARNIIPRLADWYDEPFADSSALPTRLVSELAQRDVTVALSGDGGDETFLGYNRYQAADALWQRMQRTPAPLRRLAACILGGVSTGIWDSLAGLLPQSRRPSLAGDKAHKLAAALRESEADGVYWGLVSHWQKSIVLGGDRPSVTAATGGIPDFGERMAYFDTVSYLPDDILAKVDRASMSVSLEARVPLLDHRLVEFAWSLPKRMRLRDGTSKWLLRQVLYRHVPAAIVDRPKSGFAVPIAEWLRGPLREWAESLLDEERLREEGWFDPAPVRRAWSEHLAGRGNHWEALWGVCVAQAWRERWAAGVET